jgi:dipeptide/tripeptide permease
MVLANRLTYVQWGFAGIVLASPLTRWLAISLEAQPTTCPSQILFGVACPLCGATWAGLHLLSGDIVTALQFNAGLVAFALALAVVAAREFFREDAVLGVANRLSTVAEC